MTGTPFGDSVVVNTWPYLGAAVTSSGDDSHASTSSTAHESTSELADASTGVDADTETSSRNTLFSMGAVVLTQVRTDSTPVNSSTQWAEDMKALLAYQAWIRSVGRMETRAYLIAVGNSSVGRRFLLWNAYSDALIPYRARVVMPGDSIIKRMLTAQHNAIQLGTPWCPLKALSALGIIHEVKGSSRCPKISISAHGAWALYEAHFGGLRMHELSRGTSGDALLYMLITSSHKAARETFP